jgi:hypothetical protein
MRRHSEGINVLYSSNTFVFLQNQTLADFHYIVAPEQLASIRSIHYHWQFREPEYAKSRYPFDQDSLGMNLWLLNPTYMPQLDHLSIFIQGPLNLRETYRVVLSQISNLYAETASPPPKSFTVRFPHPQLLNTPSDMHSQGLDKLLADPSIPFKIVRPTKSCQGTLADGLDVGVDVGWRYGVLSLPTEAGDEENQEAYMKNYLVWTPVPKGGKWPYEVPA